MDQNTMPPVAEPVQIPTTTPEFLIPQKKKKSPRIIAVAVVLILGIVGGVAAYVYDFARPEPKVVFTNAVMSYKDVRSLAFATKGEGSVKTPAQGAIPVSDISYTFNYNGAFDFRDLKDPSFELNVKGNLNAHTGQDSYDASGDIGLKAVDKMAYGQLRDATINYNPSTPNEISQAISSMKGVIDSVKGKWVSYPFDLSQIIDEAKLKELPQDKFKQLTDKLLSFDYIEKVDTLADETVSGVSTYHYRVTIDTDKLKNIVEDVKQARILNENNPMVAAVVTRAIDTKTTTNPQFEIWIGKKDWHVYRLASQESTYQDDSTQVTITSKGTVDFSLYNEDMKITAPQESMTAEEFQRQFEQAYMNSPAGQAAHQSGLDASMKANLDNLRAIAELYYNAHKNSYAGFCKSGILNTAADSYLKATVDQILKSKNVTTQAKAGIICVGSATAYAVSMPISGSETYCIDSKGYFGKAKINKTKLSCTPVQ